MVTTYPDSRGSCNAIESGVTGTGRNMKKLFIDTNAMGVYTFPTLRSPILFASGVLWGETRNHRSKTIHLNMYEYDELKSVCSLVSIRPDPATNTRIGKLELLASRHLC